MKGFFSKLMNKKNDLPNPAGLKTPNQNANQNQTNPPGPKPTQTQNNAAKNLNSTFGAFNLSFKIVLNSV